MSLSLKQYIILALRAFRQGESREAYEYLKYQIVPKISRLISQREKLRGTIRKVIAREKLAIDNVRGVYSITISDMQKRDQNLVDMNQRLGKENEELRMQVAKLDLGREDYEEQLARLKELVQEIGGL